ncbi:MULTISPECIES: hypothetical protein [unclassified Pseudomonas]|uniref:hypothetical protein n=1 Tax=unclassified Pseudomonas TaxID=196821 RepID=UPI0013E1A907|nr:MULTISPECIES: hypothetical protein [unclassified Pseudomonas]QIH07894.1 hypothetical protein ATY02_14830 [Pseudomonas sp. BIOMIG1BAC]UMZ09227.1 hypothetical protein I9018_16870 [Pseudomonas sp. MPFS]
MNVLTGRMPVVENRSNPLNYLGYFIDPVATSGFIIEPSDKAQAVEEDKDHAHSSD